MEPTVSVWGDWGVILRVFGYQSAMFWNFEKYYHTLARGAGAYSVNVSLTIFFAMCLSFSGLYILK